MDTKVIEAWAIVWRAAKSLQESGKEVNKQAVLHKLGLMSDKCWANLPDLEGVDVTDDQVEAWLRETRKTRVQKLREIHLNRMETESLPGEDWREIEEAPGYFVSSLGRVWSAKNVAGIVPQREKGKKYGKSGGYDRHLNVTLVIEGKPKRKSVHRLVAKAFIPNPEGYATVDHIDENPHNNRKDNLRWCPMEQNIQYYIDNHFLSKEQKAQIKDIQDTQKLIDITEPGESWRKVPGYPNYLISDRGRVWSKVRCRLVVHETKGGLPAVILSNNYNHSNRSVAYLVAEIFLGRKEEKAIVRYKDGDKRNCSADNLYWEPMIRREKRAQPRAQYGRMIHLILADGREGYFNSCRLASEWSGINQSHLSQMINGFLAGNNPSTRASLDAVKLIERVNPKSTES